MVNYCCFCFLEVDVGKQLQFCGLGKTHGQGDSLKVASSKQVNFTGKTLCLMEECFK